MKGDEGETIEKLTEMGISVLEPESKKEKRMAEAFDAFSSFVLEDSRENCKQILDRHLEGGSSSDVGELAGGNDENKVYRVVIPQEDEDVNPPPPATALLQEFFASQTGKRYRTILTIERLKQYMLGICNRRYAESSCDEEPRRYSELGNLMFILSFGPTKGQVRHIDNMVSNVQLLLYMSSDCPSTIVYDLEEGPPITNGRELIEFWKQAGKGDVCVDPPMLVCSILEAVGDAPLREKWYTKYFAFWDSINYFLLCFGKLYKPIQEALSVQTQPGTTLLAGGNDVHSGPPTIGPRMLAFAIGIPEEEDDQQRHKNSRHKQKDDKNEDNDGEVQYNLATFHIDLCCILFGIMDYDCNYSKEINPQEHQKAKHFLISQLPLFFQEYPSETYDHLLAEDRLNIKEWISKVVSVLGDEQKVNLLLQEAVEDPLMFYSPAVIARRQKKTRKIRQKLRL